MRDIPIEDIVRSVLSTSKDDAAKIIDRYCEYRIKQQKNDWVAEIRAERKKQLDDSSFTKAIEYIERMSELSKPNHHEILTAIKMVAEAFREREDKFYRRPPQ